MSTEVKLNVTEIQRFCMHDGPGVRTAVFLKGCPLRCAWCHNPETQKKESEVSFYKTKCIGCAFCVDTCPEGAHVIADGHCIEREKCIRCFKCINGCPTGAVEVCGREMTVDEIISAVMKDKAFYGENGGITVSGGEPLMQGDATVELLKESKKNGLSTVVETCGYADPEILRSAIPYTDLFLWDIKDTDDARHKHYTGVSNRLIMENLSFANGLGAKIRLRCILINGINTKEEHYLGIVEIARKINLLEGVEIIPYHAYGGSKATFIGREDNGCTEWIPTEEQIEYARNCLRDGGIRIV
ncbi:MAG: glycyl-radical enzyme activating protein [Clostridia bacterium]|nr:glycyl-radical enzyme activating protein [Clostridia bacterium]